MPAKILLLDDDALFRSVVSETLQRRGHTVVLAATGAQADELFKKQPPDLLIIDGLLPDTNGMEWIQKHRREIGDRRILFVSAFWRDVNTHRKLLSDYGVAQVIAKPVDAEALADKVDMELSASAPAAAAFEEEDVQIFDEPPAVSTDPFELAVLRRDAARTLSGRLRELVESMRRAQGKPVVAHLVDARLRCQKLAALAVGCGFDDVARFAHEQEAALRAFSGGVQVPEARWAPLYKHAEETLVRVKQETTPHPQRTRSPALLIVSPDEGALKHLRAILPPSVCTVVTARNAEEAVIAAQQGTISAALVDGALSGEVDASATVELLRAGAAQLPLGFIAGGDARALMQLARTLGSTVWVPRPFAREIVIEGACRLLEVARPRTHKVVVLVQHREAEELAFWMARYGIQSQPVRMGEDTIVELAQAKPDGVFIDLSPQDFGEGLKVIRAIRARPHWEDLPVLVVTADEHRLGALEAGADDVFTRAMSFDEKMTALRLRVEKAARLRAALGTDPATGLPSRRAFIEALARRMADARRNGQTLTVALLQLQGLEALRSRQGLRGVDDVLGDVGTVVEFGIRTEDLRGAWDEDTVAVALLGAGKQNVERVLQRLKEAEQSLALRGLRRHGFSAQFKASFAQFPTDGTSALELLQVALSR